MSQSTYIFCKEDLQYVQPAVCVPQVVAIVESGSLHVEKFFFTCDHASASMHVQSQKYPCPLSSVYQAILKLCICCGHIDLRK